jgi:hypothetical protein
VHNWNNVGSSPTFPTVKIEQVLTYEVDLAKERKRLKKEFVMGLRAAGDRQLAILDALEEKNLGKVADLYAALPYCEIGECPEQEYIGLWFYNICDRRADTARYQFPE